MPRAKSKSLQKVPHQELERLVLPLLEKKKRITPGQMTSFIKKAVALYAPHMVPDLMEALRRGLARDDRAAMELTAEVMGMRAKGTGVTFNNNNTASAAAVVTDTGGRSFDSIIRDLSAGRAKEQTIDVTPA